jgi:hypothetical protein
MFNHWPSVRRKQRARPAASRRRPAAPITLIMAGVTFLAGGQLTARSVGQEISDRPAGSEPRRSPRDTIGIMSFYGLRTVTELQARQALVLHEGDPVPQSQREIAAGVLRLERLPGVDRARLTRLCCDEHGRTILYVGIAEKGAPRFTYRPAPTARVTLPRDLIERSHRFDRLLQAAVEQGDIGEDDSRGHALSHNPRLRSLQEGLAVDAARYLRTLQRVLHTAADSEQRQIAAWIIGYAPDKRAVVIDLLDAVRDPDEGVRNDAARSVMAIAVLSQRRPEQRIHIAAAPFIGMLRSLVWEDRNKAAAVLLWLTARRSAPVITALRAQALSSLIEMARWKHPGHAQAAFILLGRVAGMSEAEIGAAWSRGDRDGVIVRALSAGSADAH